MQIITDKKKEIDEEETEISGLEKNKKFEIT